MNRGDVKLMIDRLQAELAALKSQEPVSDEALIKFAVDEEFLLFCNEDEFIDISKAVLRKFHPAPATCKTCEALARAVMCDQTGAA